MNHKIRKPSMPGSPYTKNLLQELKSNLITAIVILYGAVRSGRMSINDAMSYFDNFMETQIKYFAQGLGIKNIPQNAITQKLHGLLTNRVTNNVNQAVQQITSHLNRY